MKPIQVKEVTDDLMKEFFRAYWKECGSKDEDFMIEEYVREAVKTFRYGLEQKTGYIDGARWDIMMFDRGLPIGIWPHVKVRYKVEDSYDGKGFEDQPFHFVVYANAIAQKDVYLRVVRAVEDLVAKLVEKFPVVAEG